MANLPEVDIDTCGAVSTFQIDDHTFTVEVISSTEDYIRVLQTVFDFSALSALFKRSDFSFHFDAINGGLLCLHA